MEPTQPSAAAARPAPRRRRLRGALFAAALSVAALAAALIAAAVALLATDAGVGIAARELSLRSGGHLAIEGATGSLLDAMHVHRIVWRGPAVQVTATDVALTWSPAALWSRSVVVHTLGAQRLEVDVEASDAAVALPASLALPFEFAIEHLAVSRLDWRVGPNRGAIRGLALSYAGGAAGSRIADLALGTDAWSLTGGAAVGAVSPFAIEGRLVLKADAAGKGAETRVSLSGTLAAVEVDGSGSAGDARFTAHAALAPLAVAPLAGFALDATGVDLAAFDSALPATRLALVVGAQSSAGGLAGRVEASNALPGSIDAGRIPLSALSAGFAWHADAVELDGIAAQLAGGGRARGRARIPLGSGDGAGTWSLDLADVDLRQIYSPLAATRLAGTVGAELDRRSQRISGDVSDRTLAGGIALRFAATVAGATVDVERFRITAARGEIAGRGRIGIEGERAFALDATAQRFDPARFGAFPAGALDGRVVASGVLAPAWRVGGTLALAPSSRLGGIAVSGSASGHFARNALRDVDIALVAGAAKLSAKGSAGGANDVLAVALDVPRLAELVPLLPGAVPRTLSGGMRAGAQWRGAIDGGAIDGEARLDALTIDRDLAIGSVDVRFALGAAQGGGHGAAARRLRLDARAGAVVTPQRTLDALRLSVDGTLAQHTLSAELASGGATVDAAAHGGLALPGAGGAGSGWNWSGAIDALEARGPLALRLEAPADLSCARGRVHVGGTRLAIADGSVQLSEFTWDEGRITTRGSFTAVPLATAARLAGVPLPGASTLKLGGEWSLAAAPRLNGTATLRRESGDLTLAGAAGVALGITAIAVDARFHDDAVDATAGYASTRGASASASLAIGTVPGAPPGRIADAAPLTFSASAELPTLTLLQPWIGTSAVVDGRAHADVQGRGTVGRIKLAGALRAEALRVDAPRYGLHFSDGRLAAHLADGNVVVDEFVLSAGAGEFRASGTAASATAADAVAAHIDWRASNFRLFNRPDLNLVVDGEGTIKAAGDKLALAGTLKAREGNVVYASDPQATLGDDVVVKGRPRAPAGARSTADLPLAVDLALDFGDRLRFASEGLDTRLAGTVRVTTGPRGLNGKGSIRAVNGSYRAFGQKLVIDPGRLVFDGPLDNPGLDIVALRRNLAVEAGVAVTGTVKVPIIQLTSNPPVPDSEKLSWLVLGQGLDRTSGSDVAALQAASALLLGRDSKSITSTVAESVGLDDIAFKSGAARGTRGGGADPGTSVVAFGKRLSDRLSLVYEQGLSVAGSALKIEYSLTRHITLQAQTGIVTGVGIHFSRSYE